MSYQPSKNRVVKLVSYIDLCFYIKQEIRFTELVTVPGSLLSFNTQDKHAMDIKDV